MEKKNEIYKHIIGVKNVYIRNQIYPFRVMTLDMEILLDKNYHFNTINCELNTDIEMEDDGFCLGETFVQGINENEITIYITFYNYDKNLVKITKKTFSWEYIIKNNLIKQRS